MIDVVFIGPSLASVFLLVALGLAITYVAMGVINMAHGEMVMLGACATVFTGLYLHLNILAAIPLAFVFTAPVGYVIERVVVRRLYDRLLDTLLATWGVAILIQQAVWLELGFSFFGLHVPGPGPGLQNVSVPVWLTGVVPVFGVGINVIEAKVSETEGLVQAWRAVIGLTFVLAALYLPRGLAGFASDCTDWALARVGRTPRQPRGKPIPAAEKSA